MRKQKKEMTGLDYAKRYTFEELIAEHRLTCLLLGQLEYRKDLKKDGELKPYVRRKVKAIEEGIMRLYAGGDYRE